MKRGPSTSFDAYQEIYQRVGNCKYLRVSCDSIPDQSTFVYRCLSNHLLPFILEDLELSVIKHILKDALRRVAAMYDQDVVHAGILDTIPMTTRWLFIVHRHQTEQHFHPKTGHNYSGSQARRLGRLIHVPLGKATIRRQIGSSVWRSPEVHAEGPLHKPSDLFSFGLVVLICIPVTLTEGVIVCMLFTRQAYFILIPQEEIKEGGVVQAHVLEGQISYFAGAQSLAEFLEIIKDSPWAEVFAATCDGLNDQNPRKSFSLWEGVSPGLKDLVLGLMKTSTPREGSQRMKLWIILG